MFKLGQLLPCSVVAAVAAAGVAHGAPVVDTFDYPDQTAFEAAYTIEKPGVTGPDVLLEADPVNPGNRIRFDFSAGAGDAFVVSPDVYQFDASTPITVGIDVTGGTGAFAPTRVGVRSVSDPSVEFFLNLERRGSDMIIEVRNQALDPADQRRSIDVPGSPGFIEASWGLVIGATEVQVTRNGNVRANSTAVHDIDFADYAAGAEVFFFSTAAGAGNVRVDNFTVDGTLIPEPASAALALVGAGVLALRRRRTA